MCSVCRLPACTARQLTSYTNSDLNFRGKPKKRNLRNAPKGTVNHELSFTLRCDSLSCLPPNDSHRLDSLTLPPCYWKTATRPSNLAAESPLHVPAQAPDEFAIGMSAIAGREFRPRRWFPSVLKLQRLVVNGSALRPLNARLLLHLLHEQSAASRNWG